MHAQSSLNTVSWQPSKNMVELVRTDTYAIQLSETKKTRLKIVDHAGCATDFKVACPAQQRSFEGNSGSFLNSEKPSASLPASSWLAANQAAGFPASHANSPAVRALLCSADADSLKTVLLLRCVDS